MDTPSLLAPSSQDNSGILAGPLGADTSQVNSVTAALKAVGMGLLDAHVRHCVKESIERGEGEEKVEELMNAVLASPAAEPRRNSRMLVGVVTHEVVVETD